MPRLGLISLFFPRCCPARVLNWNWERDPAQEELSPVETFPVVFPETPLVTQPEDILLYRGDTMS